MDFCCFYFPLFCIHWLMSKYFISVFLFLHNLIIHEFPNKPLKEIRNAMRNELKLWKQRIQAEDEL